jgi:hypothetical protein
MARTRRAAAKLEEQASPAETIRYVNLMAGHLRALAADEGLEFLAYLLGMVESEAMGLTIQAEKAPAEQRSA